MLSLAIFSINTQKNIKSYIKELNSKKSKIIKMYELNDMFVNFQALKENASKEEINELLDVILSFDILVLKENSTDICVDFSDAIQDSDNTSVKTLIKIKAKNKDAELDASYDVEIIKTDLASLTSYDKKYLALHTRMLSMKNFQFFYERYGEGTPWNLFKADSAYNSAEIPVYQDQNGYLNPEHRVRWMKEFEAMKFDSKIQTTSKVQK